MNELLDYKAPEPSKIIKFLWWCAGADKQVLKYSNFSDHAKYTGIGGGVLATGVLAGISMGFAMHIIFSEPNAEGVLEGNWFVTIPIALLWGLIIFNLDRFIVSSTGKGDGKASISFMELVNSFPRLSMAVILGLSIAAPLETYIFQKEIQREWQESKQQMVTKRLYEIDQQYAVEDEAKSTALREKKSAVAKQEFTVVSLRVRVTAERQSGTGPQWRSDTADLNRENKRLVALRHQLDSTENSAKGLIPEKKRIKEQAEKEILAIQSGFLDQIMMLEKLSVHGKEVPKFDPINNQIIEGEFEEVYAPAFWPIWLVRLMFMVIEIAPVLLKLMLIKGPYDYMLENLNEVLETKQGIIIEHIQDERSKIHKVRRHIHPSQIGELNKFQKERELYNSKVAIDEFSKKERLSIENNPDDFIERKDNQGQDS